MNILIFLASLGLPTTLLMAGSLAIAGNKSHDHDHHKEQRQHGTHEHGSAQMNVAIDNNRLQLELEIPAMNIIGFEHLPKNQNQRQAVKQAVMTLKKGSALYILTSAAKCSLANVQVKSLLMDEKHHSHTKHGHKVTHSEFNAIYTFHCKNIKMLKSMDVQLFKKFTSTKKIKVQIITEKGQKMKILTPKQHKFSL